MSGFRPSRATVGWSCSRPPPAGASDGDSAREPVGGAESGGVARGGVESRGVASCGVAGCGEVAEEAATTAMGAVMAQSPGWIGAKAPPPSAALPPSAVRPLSAAARLRVEASALASAAARDMVSWFAPPEVEGAHV